jgi:hypothetical protein
MCCFFICCNRLLSLFKKISIHFKQIFNYPTIGMLLLCGGLHLSQEILHHTLPWSSLTHEIFNLTQEILNLTQEIFNLSREILRSTPLGCNFRIEILHPRVLKSNLTQEILNLTLRQFNLSHKILHHTPYLCFFRWDNHEKIACIAIRHWLFTLCS